MVAVAVMVMVVVMMIMMVMAVDSGKVSDVQNLERDGDDDLQVTILRNFLLFFYYRVGQLRRSYSTHPFPAVLFIGVISFVVIYMTTDDSSVDFRW